ncbi:MAG: hypothetical protein GEU82_05700 [Luteitalea sp.]|nr:hypothetical protein [Luteitalea sp.]
MHRHRVLPTLLLAGLIATTIHAQQVTKEKVAGVTNFARLETTIACAGATKAEVVPELKKMGFASIINLREASEAGADVDAEAAAAKAAGINYTHIPFNVASPAPDTVDRFLAAVTKPENNPAFIHCAGGGRAATMWAIKRMQVDGWDQQKALDEAAALGMNSDRLKNFAINYAQTHKR